MFEAYNKTFFVDSKGNVQADVWRGPTEGPHVLERRDVYDRFGVEEKDQEELARVAGEQRISTTLAKDRFIVERLAAWPVEALQYLVAQRPVDNLAYQALKKIEERKALREELVKKGKEVMEKRKNSKE